MHIPTPLINEHFDDRYFDVLNAVDEIRQIFFVNCDLARRLEEAVAKGTPFIIGELGFGMGRAFAALVDLAVGNNRPGVSVVYNSVELYPVSADRMAGVLEMFRGQIGPAIDQVVSVYRKIDPEKQGWQQVRMELHPAMVTLNLWIGEALEMARALPVSCDAWLLDGHGPKKNPDMWRPELLMAVGEKTVPVGTCATYTVAGHVRRALADAGFVVEQVPGCGGKKGNLRGVKQDGTSHPCTV